MNFQKTFWEFLKINKDLGKFRSIFTISIISSSRKILLTKIEAA